MISVVMPAYNAEAYISEAISSIRLQTFRDFELIVVDDGSADATVKIASAHAAQDERIRVLRSDHAGASAARNLGGREAKCPWIAVMDSDDVALPERLEKQMAAVTANPRIVALGTAVYHMAAGRALGISRHGPESEAEFYRRRLTGEDICLNHPTTLMKREIWLEAGGYDVAFSDCDDFEMFDRIAAYGPILTLTEPLQYYRVHQDSLSMRRFFAQRMISRYITARNKARVCHEPQMSFEEFVSACRQRPLGARLRWWVDDLGYYHYRKAGLYFGESHYPSAIFHLGLSTFLRPNYVLPRLWRQRLSPESRQLMKKGRVAGAGE
jgi:glycosyltransferase involved in cell wall biosynthesis